MTAFGDVPLLDPETGRFPDAFAPPAVAEGVIAATASALSAGLALTGAESARDATVAAAGGSEASAALAAGAATASAQDALEARQASDAVIEMTETGYLSPTALSAAIVDKTAAPIAAKASLTPMGSIGFEIGYVDSGHLFLGFDETGAMISNLVQSVGARTLGRSTDNGETWTAVGTPNAANNVAGFWVTTANTWLAYSFKKLYRSTNQGGTWTEVATTGTLMNSALTQEPDGTLWAAEYLGSARVFRSTDDGATWSVAYDFPNTDDSSGTVIRHIHGIKSLPSGLWAYTGDNNTECGLWRWEGGTFVRKSPALTDTQGGQRWRAVDVIERNGWLYWAQDGASAAGEIPAIVKAHPSDLAGTLTILAPIPTGGWYITKTPSGDLLVGSVNEGIGKESDRATRLWVIDNADKVTEIWTVPPSNPIGVDFPAVRNLAVRADGLVVFTVNQTDMATGSVTVTGRVTSGGRALAVSRATTPRAYPGTARAWSALGTTAAKSTTSGAYAPVPEMATTINTRTVRPLLVNLTLDLRVSAAGLYLIVRLVAVNKHTGGITNIGRPGRVGSTAYGPLALTGIFTPPAPGDYTIRAEWVLIGTGTGESGSDYQQLTVVEL